MIKFTILRALSDDQIAGMLGFLPEFFNENDKRPAAVQLDEMYAHGGGWRPLHGWAMRDLENGVIKYPGDPQLRPLAVARLHDEIIYVYENAWVAIVQPDGSFEVGRVD